MMSFLEGYNKTNEVLKQYQRMPVLRQTVQRDRIVKVFSIMKKSVIEKCASFQNDVTLQWNLESKQATKLLAPPVASHD